MDVVCGWLNIPAADIGHLLGTIAKVFHTQSLTLFELSICIGSSLIVFAIIELKKLVTTTAAGRRFSVADVSKL